MLPGRQVSQTCLDYCTVCGLIFRHGGMVAATPVTKQDTLVT